MKAFTIVAGVLLVFVRILVTTHCTFMQGLGMGGVAGIWNGQPEIVNVSVESAANAPSAFTFEFALEMETDPPCGHMSVELTLRRWSAMLHHLEGAVVDLHGRVRDLDLAGAFFARDAG